MENEKIDFVITWVDGSDANWLKEKYEWEKKEKNINKEIFEKWINAKSRYRNWDYLRYWFRAVEKYASWVNKIYFITWGHIPEWLNINNPKLVIINHKDFIPKEYLPTFNSNTIELNIHRIKGLSENFVLFNDDMFINDYVKEKDFFRNNKPCEIAGFDVIKTNYYITNADINNTKILNKYFDKRKVLRNKNWYRLKYGKYLIKTLVLLRWKEITGIAEQHIPCSYNKKNFNWIWENEPTICHETGLSKFRKENNINHWVVKGYQLLSNNFYPRSFSFGKSYFKIIDTEIINDIINHKHKIICINDVECTDEEFEEQKATLLNAFNSVLPTKSSFEK